ncbi:MAG: diaminopimelate epimerase [Labilithrix sp.]|nr:diaminopimelate epimerase [Labilithrix sp.]MCW5810677.1 diaminopimelate epimerase [Labilithrix sp.]
MSGALDFYKYEGLGNDFVVIEAARDDAVTVDLARRLCDRRLGVGADGVLLVLPGAAGTDGRMRVINADGSIPEMCGNGLRCVALHVARTRNLAEGALRFDTDAGEKRCDVAGNVVTIDMGPVRHVGDVELEGFAWSLGDAGNPHAITIQPADRSTIERVGPRVEKHAHFPNGTNVEFAVVKAPDEIDLVVWERGVGITQACGTGACATVAVAIAKGWVPAGGEVRVNLLGGPLSIRMTSEGHAIMRGPASFVFRGSVPA